MVSGEFQGGDYTGLLVGDSRSYGGLIIGYRDGYLRDTLSQRLQHRVQSRMGDTDRGLLQQFQMWRLLYDDGIARNRSTSFYEMDLPPGKGIALHSHPYAEVFYVVMGHTDFLRVDEQGQEEWVRCGPGDTLVAPMNALHAFHNRTDKPSRFISSSVSYHKVCVELYAPTVAGNDPLPPKKEPTEADGEVYLQLLKNAM